jgi:hypothetical protein
MKLLIKHTTIAFLGSLIFIQSCKKDEGKDATNPAPINAQEQITTVIVQGYDQDDTSKTFFIKWEDLDGAGGNTPNIDTLKVDSGFIYVSSILLIDKTQTPWDTISNEVEAEKNVHQFFYTLSQTLNGKAKIDILDYDNNSPALPVGLSFQLNTHSGTQYSLPLSGSLKVVLSHYDGIPKTAAPSPESDVDITFPVVLK